jgi:hypothetical protein
MELLQDNMILLDIFEDVSVNIYLFRGYWCSLPTSKVDIPSL